MMAVESLFDERAEVLDLARSWGWSDRALAGLFDYATYHHYGNHSTIGVIDTDGTSHCVGCHWCWPDDTAETEADDWLQDFLPWLYDREKRDATPGRQKDGSDA